MPKCFTVAFRFPKDEVVSSVEFKVIRRLFTVTTLRQVRLFGQNLQKKKRGRRENGGTYFVSNVHAQAAFFPVCLQKIF